MYVRSSTWHSITAAVHHYDSTFIAWRFLLRAIAKELVRKRQNLTTLQAEATKALESALAAGHGAMDAQTKEQHKAAMQEIKKKAGRGNHILICPLLMHNANFFNMRVLLQVGQFLWSEQTAMAMMKKKPEQELQYSISLSTGHGEELLKEMWWNTVMSSPRSTTIGTPRDLPSPPPPDGPPPSPDHWRVTQREGGRSLTGQGDGPQPPGREAPSGVQGPRRPPQRQWQWICVYTGQPSCGLGTLGCGSA